MVRNMRPGTISRHVPTKMMMLAQIDVPSAGRNRPRPRRMDVLEGPLDHRRLDQGEEDHGEQDIAEPGLVRDRYGLALH
jgi:hypothetical protein